MSFCDFGNKQKDMLLIKQVLVLEIYLKKDIRQNVEKTCICLSEPC